MQISLDEIRTGGNFQDNRMPYFKLADNEIAYVRFMPGAPEMFNTHHVNFTTANGKSVFTSVDCLRATGQPLDVCPFCAADDTNIAKIHQESYIKLIKYERADDGRNVFKPFIWSRTASWVRDNFINYVNTYGPNLVNVLFQIQRKGKMLDTTYQLTPLVGIPNFSDKEYPVPHTDPFDDYTAHGTNLTVKSADDMRYFLQCKNFPYNVTTNSSADATGVDAFGNLAEEELPFGKASSVDVSMQPVVNTPVQQPVMPTTAMPAQFQNNAATVPVQPVTPAAPTQTTPWASAQPAMDRPVRRYN